MYPKNQRRVEMNFLLPAHAFLNTLVIHEINMNNHKVIFRDSKWLKEKANMLSIRCIDTYSCNYHLSYNWIHCDDSSV